jgi:transcriptional regulator with XRE-family HTH domain
MKENNAFGDLIRAAREKRLWSLTLAASNLGCTKGHLHDLESGRHKNPTLNILAKVVSVYKIPAKQIFACAPKQPQGVKS